MADIKIEGLWSWLDPIMSDPNHPSGLHLQITKLGLLTRIILDGDKFNATIFSGGRSAFLESYTVASAVALNAAGVSFEGYPCWITVDDPATLVPSDWPAAVNVDEDGNETLKTFAEWCETNRHDIYTDGSGSFAGNFHKHGWSFLMKVNDSADFGLIDESVAKARIEALQPVE